MQSQRKIFIRICWALLFGLGLVWTAPAWAEKIVIFGDSQLNEPAQRRVAAAVIREQPEIVFRVGDLVDDGDDPAQWALFREINAPLIKTTEYYPCLGNHEYDSPLYFEQFPFLKGRRWYSVDRAGIHFTILDSNSPLSLDSDQYQWLKWDLGGTREGVRYKIVIFHHPLFNVGERHAPDEKNIRYVLLPLFEKYGVDAVFNGHEHNYQRLEYEGIIFIITGGGGAQLSGQARGVPYLKKFKKAYHFCIMTPGNNGIRIRVRDVDQNLIDEFLIGDDRSRP